MASIADYDFEAYLKRSNPYATKTYFDFSPATSVAGSFGDLGKAIDWEDKQRSRQSQFSSIFRTGSAAPAINPEFTLTKVSKDPTGQYDSLNAGFLSKLKSARPTTAPYQAAATGAVKAVNDPDIAAGTSANKTDTQTLIENWNALKGKLDAMTSSQSKMLDTIYAPESDPTSLSGRLASDRTAARRSEMVQAERGAQQALLSQRLKGVEGTNSYDAAILADTLSRARQDVEARDAERRRQDLATIIAAQERNIGRGQELESANVMRAQIPIQLRTALADTILSQAGQGTNVASQAAALDQATDEISTIARQLGISGQALQQYLAGNFLGTRKEGSDYSLPVSGFSGRRRPQLSQPRDPYEPDGYYPNGYEPAQQPNSRGNPGTRNNKIEPETFSRSAAEEWYKYYTGYYPDQDPMYEPEIMGMIQDDFARAGKEFYPVAKFRNFVPQR